MKKVLLTGENSYIGKSLEMWLSTESHRYKVNKISLRSDSWKNTDFSYYDTIIHVAGIAHMNEKKVDKDFYYKIVFLKFFHRMYFLVGFKASPRPSPKEREF